MKDKQDSETTATGPQGRSYASAVRSIVVGEEDGSEACVNLPEATSIPKRKPSKPRLTKQKGVDISKTDLHMERRGSGAASSAASSGLKRSSPEVFVLAWSHALFRYQAVVTLSCLLLHRWLDLSGLLQVLPPIRDRSLPWNLPIGSYA